MGYPKSPFRITLFLQNHEIKLAQLCPDPARSSEPVYSADRKEAPVATVVIMRI